MNDNDVLEWGKYAGVKMANMPASYLLYLYDNDKCHGPIKGYIEENIEDLRAEAERDKSAQYIVRKATMTG